MALQRPLRPIVGDAADGGPGSIAFGDQAPSGVLSLAGDDPYRFRPPGGDAAHRRIAGPRDPPLAAHVQHPAVRFDGSTPPARRRSARPVPQNHTTVPSVGSPPMLPCVLDRSTRWVLRCRCDLAGGEVTGLRAHAACPGTDALPRRQQPDRRPTWTFRLSSPSGAANSPPASSPPPSCAGIHLSASYV